MAQLKGNFDPVMFNEPAFQLAPRAAEPGPGKLTWQTSAAQLTAAFDSKELMVFSSSPLYWAGWEWSSHVMWSAAAGGTQSKSLGMFTTVRTPGLLGLSKEPVAVTADVETTMASDRDEMERCFFCSDRGRGRCDMGLVPAVPSAAAVAAALGPHLQGTQLPLTLTVSNVL
jgi:hypothetical protein